MSQNRNKIQNTVFPKTLGLTEIRFHKIKVCLQQMAFVVTLK